MPARGYRKGANDTKVPLPVSARTRLPSHLHKTLIEDAGQRRVTVSRLLRAILEQHYQRRPLPRVKASGPTYAVARELNRIGVNLNQLTHLANATRLVPLVEIHRLLERISAVITRL